MKKIILATITLTLSLLGFSQFYFPNNVHTHFKGKIRIDNEFFFRSDITPSQITANQNDYNPSGLTSTTSGATIVRLSSDASRDITGLSGGARGRVIFLDNVGSFNIVLKNISASSTAANRFLFGQDVTLQPNQGIMIRYDSTVSRWRMVGGLGGGGGSGDFIANQQDTVQEADAWVRTMRARKLWLGTPDSANVDSTGLYKPVNLYSVLEDTTSEENDGTPVRVNGYFKSRIHFRGPSGSMPGFAAVYRGNLIGEIEAVLDTAIRYSFPLGGDLIHGIQGVYSVINKSPTDVGTYALSNFGSPVNNNGALQGVVMTKRVPGTPDDGSYRTVLMDDWFAISSYLHLHAFDSVGNFMHFRMNAFNPGAKIGAENGIVLPADQDVERTKTSWGIVQLDPAKRSYNLLQGRTLIGNNYGTWPHGPSYPSGADLAINSTTGGFLLPRMTGAEMLAITSPSTGLLVICTDSSNRVVQHVGGGVWRPLLYVGETGGGSSGTVNTGAANKPAYYPSAGTTVDDFDPVDYFTSGTNVTVTASDAEAIPVRINGATNHTTELLNVSPTTASTRPAFSVNPNGSVGITPYNETWYQQKDEFRTMGQDGNNFGNNGTASSSAVMGTGDIIDGWMFGLHLQTGTSTTGYGYYVPSSSGATGVPIAINNARRYSTGTKIRFEDLSDGTNSYEAFYGFCEVNTTVAGIVDGIYWRYNHADSSGKFIWVTESNGTKSEKASSVTVAADTDYTIHITVFAGTAYFYINGDLDNTITTNIPTGTARSTNIFGGIFKTAGTTNRSMYVDWAAFGVREN